MSRSEIDVSGFLLNATLYEFVALSNHFTKSTCGFLGLQFHVNMNGL